MKTPVIKSHKITDATALPYPASDNINKAKFIIADIVMMNDQK
jgi:hypothetical protein